MWITSFYAGLLTLLFLFLSVHVINLRSSPEVALGDVDGLMMRRRRVHENFARYVPLGLILMALGEFQHLSSLLLHAIGLLLLGGQLVHALTVGKDPEVSSGRALGTAMTLIALTIGAVSDLAIGAIGLFAIGP
jgi:uncharacterized membrane protein YecN with MAPEG domain